MVYIVAAAAWIGLLIAWIAALVSARRVARDAYSSAGRSRGGTIALILLAGWIGALYYWLAINRDLRAHASAS